MVQHFLNNGQALLSAADVVVVPIPFYDHATSTDSAVSAGAAAILKASAQLETYDLAENYDLARTAIHTVVSPGELSDFSSMTAYLASSLASVQCARQFYLGLGGDRAITLPILKIFTEQMGDYGVVHLGAQMGIHPMQANASVLQGIATELGGAKLLSIGLRQATESAASFLRAQKIMYVPGNRGFHEDLTLDLMEKLHRLPQKIFLKIDLDFFDPAHLPHVANPIPGGLSWTQSLAIFRKIFQWKTVVGADISGLTARGDSDHSAMAAALLAQKLVVFAQRASGSGS